ncbi:LURP-one-related family protein [Planococcus sp. CP5-4]|uniref:LURP-one-related/scramblase family protein n=1 Tax=unclassified Planococcus (in: firmicutes) TaxID=2662419 RepID=UPI001C24DE68|nr:MULTISPECIES: LURP-one-related family protein [unclassified Planococcus (in: firmicutes)]MBU9674248.1 LURP-one-related family protein [Planococcus sp. CP5-4_YE]MBV0909280.1 LURP-one-related family protein [Planococcus sp. CP5-4_UN]MBW6063772.1 LURP-one-related family protein [Planococcus sp. CP5-4]
MKQLYIKQKVFSLSEKFTVKDEQEQDRYFVEGSFLKIPKTFSILDAENQEIGVITKKTFSFLPTFFVEVDGQEAVTIKKEFTFLKPRYAIEAEGIDVEGDWWEMSFDILRHGQVIGSVSKQWLSWGDTYQVDILDETMEHLVISLVVAIDCVKADQAAASAGG